MKNNPLKKISSDTMEIVAARFRALGEVSRLNIIQVLEGGEKNVTALVKLTGLSQSNVSRHLSVLVACGLIARKKKGLNVLYRVADKNLKEICAIVCKSVANKSRDI